MKRQAVEIVPGGVEPNETNLADRRWRRFALAYLGVFAGVVGIVYVFIIAVDPYDSGRFASLGLSGLLDELQRGGHAAAGGPAQS
jgi:hypothetical protein